MRTSCSTPTEQNTRRDDLARRVFDAGTASVAVLDERAHIRLVNVAWDEFALDNGGEPAVLGTDYLAVCDAAADDPTIAAIADGLRGVLSGTLDEFREEYPCHSPSRQRWFELIARPLALETQVGLVVAHEDITDRKLSRDEGQRRALLVDEVDAAVVGTDLAGVVTSWSLGAQRLYGWSMEAAVGRPIYELISDPGTWEAASEFIQQLVDAQTWEGEFTARREDGTSVPIHVRNSVVRDAEGSATGMVSVAVDETERLALDIQLHAITDSIGEGLCTLDHAWRVTYANPSGLRMLQASPLDLVGTSFWDWMREVDGARIGEDAVQEGGVNHPVTCVVVRSDGTVLPIELIATPLRARRTAPATGWVVVFRDISARQAREDALAKQVDEVAWLRRIRGALDHDGLVLHAQPIVDLATGDTVQHELLLRMRDPEAPGELIAPGRFLPTAERLGVAPAIDRWVLARGLEFAARGNPVEINLSATSLDDTSLPYLIEEQLAESGADPADVVFELTETALLENHVNARSFADRLHELGCRLALDDFGTGYGGFTYLKQFPLDYLKIDIEFVRDALVNRASRHVIQAVVSLAAAFDLETVAEGVEDDATLDLLRQMGVDRAQGYLLGRPAPTSDVFPTAARRDLP